MNNNNNNNKTFLYRFRLWANGCRCRSQLGKWSWL